MSEGRIEEKDDENDYHEQDTVSDDDKTTDPAKKNISCLPQDFSIRELRLMVSAHELNLQPDWQRNFVYDRKKASKLIESILMDVPIPALYFAQEATGHYSVIDGQQRLTSFISTVMLRFKKWKEMLDSIVSGAPQPRIFSYEVKKQLFQKDSTCKICGDQILLIEDAEIDHIKPFSEGGTTTIENAQLAHRYCNRHKSDKPA